MLVKDKFGNVHSVPDNYDNEEIIVPSTQTKQFNGLTPNDLLTRNQFNMNRASTKVNENRAVTLKITGSNMRSDLTGLRSSRRPKNW